MKREHPLTDLRRSVRSMKRMRIAYIGLHVFVLITIAFVAWGIMMFHLKELFIWELLNIYTAFSTLRGIKRQKSMILEGEELIKRFEELEEKFKDQFEKIYNNPTP